VELVLERGRKRPLARGAAVERIAAECLVGDNRPVAASRERDVGCIETQIVEPFWMKSRNTSSSFSLDFTSPMPVSSRTHASPASHSSPSQLSRRWSASGSSRTSLPLAQSMTSAALGLSTPVKYQKILSCRNCM
jgi:hypothetical protein